MSINETKFRELLQKYVDTEYNVLIGLARQSLDTLEPFFQKRHGEKATIVIIAILNAGIGADGQLTAKEKQFLEDAFGIKPETVELMIDAYNGKEEDLVNAIHDNVEDDIKYHLFNLVAILAACDNTISRDEIAFLKKVLE